MNKKRYQQPVVRTVCLRQQQYLLAGSEVSGLGGNANLNLGGGGNSVARSRYEDYLWDEDYE